MTKKVSAETLANLAKGRAKLAAMKGKVGKKPAPVKDPKMPKMPKMEAKPQKALGPKKGKK